MRLPLFFCLSLVLTGPGLAAGAAPADLIGSWEVTGVAVADSPVQALAADDPAYMGAVLDIGKNSLIWAKGTEIRPIDPAIDNCPADVAFHEMDGKFYITCAEAPWGPADTGGIFQQVSASEITLIWYDGGQLTLTRQN